MIAGVGSERQTERMNIAPGELYFIRETDYLTNKLTNYVKIGLVKDVEGRTSTDRAAEHQTGNPRTLSVYKVVKTPAISEVENIVHKLYATHRIEGEWFHFTDAQLATAIKAASQIADEIKANAKAITTAQELKTRPSTEKVVKPTAKLLGYFEEYHTANVKFKACKELVEQYKDLVKAAADDGEDISSVAKVKPVKDQEVLDIEALSEKYPDLWQQYCVTTSRVSGSFRWATYSGNELSLQKIDKTLFALTEEFAQLLSSKSKSAKAALHEKHLVLLGHQARAELDREIAAAKVQIICKDAKSIDGICTWKREVKESVNFDISTFVSEHPKIAAQLTSTKKKKASVVVKPKRSQKV